MNYYDLSVEEQKQAIYDEMRRLANGDVAPTIDTWNKNRQPGLPNNQTIWRHFGSWRKLVKDAGLRQKPNKVDEAEEKYTHEDIYAAMRDLADADGTAPSQRYWDDHKPDGYPVATTIHIKFGTWSDMCEGAGLRMRSRGPRPNWQQKEAVALDSVDAEVERMMCPPERAHLREPLRLYRNGQPRQTGRLHWDTYNRRWRRCDVYVGQFK